MNRLDSVYITFVCCSFVTVMFCHKHTTQYYKGLPLHVHRQCNLLIIVWICWALHGTMNIAPSSCYNSLLLGTEMMPYWWQFILAPLLCVSMAAFNHMYIIPRTFFFCTGHGTTGKWNISGCGLTIVSHITKWQLRVEYHSFLLLLVYCLLTLGSHGIALLLLWY